MSKRLSKNLSSRYLEAAQRMRPQKARQKITAFVESYDDVFFWSTLLHELETEDFYFEIVLPLTHKPVEGQEDCFGQRDWRAIGRLHDSLR